jgi:hypothetical protein
MLAPPDADGMMLVNLIECAPVWYSITCFSEVAPFPDRISLIHGKGCWRPIELVHADLAGNDDWRCNEDIPLNIGALRPSTPRGMVSPATVLS